MRRNAVLLAGCLLSALILSRTVMAVAPGSAGTRTTLAMLLPCMLGLYGRALGAGVLPVVGASTGAAAVFWLGIGAPQGLGGLGLMAVYFLLMSFLIRTWRAGW